MSTATGPEREGNLMALSARYVAREAGANLWRNRLMTSVAILTVFVTLALAGSALLAPPGGRERRRSSGRTA